MIKIKKSETADTRNCDYKTVTKQQLLESTKSHIRDIHRGLEFFAYLIHKQAAIHDLTKISHLDDFYRNFQTGFAESDWWELHQRLERHHFNNPEYIQEDINLIDILDQIVDGVMAGLARSGEYRQEAISGDLLLKAYRNTVNLLLANVEIDKE